MTDTVACVAAPISPQAVELAQRHLHDMLAYAIEHRAGQAAVVVYDRHCPLAATLEQGYRACLPQARFLDFDAYPPEQILVLLEGLEAGGLAVLVQSTNFRLGAYRIRVELFKRGLKVIEHPHLSRMPGEQALHYIEALAYDADYFRGVGYGLKARIDRARSATVDSGGAQLIYGGPLEAAKLNVGDYREVGNVGGQFPIGEVFTEAQDLETVNGRARIFVFGDTSYLANRPPQPITLVVERGRVRDVLDSTPAFEQVLSAIRAEEGDIWVRELGFGLNRAFSQACGVADIGSYERMCGVHLSLGAKHGVYSKSNIRRTRARYHIDVFVDTHGVMLDDTVVFRDGAWQV